MNDKLTAHQRALRLRLADRSVKAICVAVGRDNQSLAEASPIRAR